MCSDRIQENVTVSSRKELKSKTKVKKEIIVEMKKKMKEKRRKKETL